MEKVTLITEESDGVKSSEIVIKMDKKENREQQRIRITQDGDKIRIDGTEECPYDGELTSFSVAISEKAVTDALVAVAKAFGGILTAVVEAVAEGAQDHYGTLEIKRTNTDEESLTS